MPVLGFIELLFLAGFFILMVIGTALDRRYNESPKWWILGIALLIAIVYFWGQVDFSSTLAAVQTWAFWQPFATYLGAGLLYSVLEFILSVRKMARVHAEAWERFTSTIKRAYTYKEGPRAGEEIDGSFVTRLDDGSYVAGVSRSGNLHRDPTGSQVPVDAIDISYREILKRAQQPEATSSDRSEAKSVFQSYLGRNEYIASNFHRDFVQVKLDPETYVVGPTINRGRLASFIGAWTFLWPAYAISLILGDFVVEVFRVIGDVFSKLGGRFVRVTFDGVFKV